MPPSPSSPHERLIAEHQHLRQLAQQLRASSDDAIRTLFPSFRDGILAHFHREDVYYRALDRGRRFEDRGLMHTLRNDHAAVTFTLESLGMRLRKNGPTPEWKAKLETMLSVLLPHFDNEERQFFPAAQQLLSEQERETIEREMGGDLA
jgi:hemerythrin-like domain-containing protein